MAKIKLPGGEEFDDEDRGIFLIVPGRYYAEQCCVRIPNAQSKFGKGGDVTSLLWRKDETPEKWVLQWRFRWYRTEGAWDGKDEKTWYSGEPTGPEAEVVANTRELFQIMAAVAGSKLGIFEIKGDCERFAHLNQTAPPQWLHSQSVVQE